MCLSVADQNGSRREFGDLSFDIRLRCDDETQLPYCDATVTQNGQRTDLQMTYLQTLCLTDGLLQVASAMKQLLGPAAPAPNKQH